MAYSVRGKFQQQSKYSNRRYNQLLDLMKVKAEDTIEIERQVNARAKKAANAGDLGPLAAIVDAITLATPTKIDDTFNTLIQGAILDKRRSNAIGGIDTDKVQFLKAAANNADMQVRDLTRQLTEGLQFKNAVKKVGVDKALKAISESEAFEKVSDKLKEGFKDIDFKGQFGSGDNMRDLLSLVKEGTGELVNQFKEYYEDPGDYIKEVSKYQNPELYRNNLDLFKSMSLSNLGKNNQSFYPYGQYGFNLDNIFSASNINKDNN